MRGGPKSTEKPWLGWEDSEGAAGTEASSPQPGSHCALTALGPAFPAKVLGIMNEMLWLSWRYHGNAALSGNTTVTVAIA